MQDNLHLDAPDATSREAKNRYKILGCIATGGMAEIYVARARDESGGERTVVLKRLLPELQSDHEFVQMFYDESRIALSLRHPNIVRIFELGELDGSLFIAMELLVGVNLRDILARLYATQTRLPLDLLVRIASDCLKGLSHAHSLTNAEGLPLHVVHRDVSPQNVLITYDGVVKLVDFGVAKAEGRLHHTRPGLVKGKFAYMSPEQISGDAVDARADLFALGEVLYELALWRHPFFATSDMDVMRAILGSDPPAPASLDPSFPAELGAIFLKAMAKKPNDRFQDAASMAHALDAVATERKWTTTAEELGAFIRDLFWDRVEAERRARADMDDVAWVKAMTVGRADMTRGPLDGKRRPPDAALSPPSRADRRSSTNSRMREEVRGLFATSDGGITHAPEDSNVQENVAAYRFSPAAEQESPRAAAVQGPDIAASGALASEARSEALPSGGWQANSLRRYPTKTASEARSEALPSGGWQANSLRRYPTKTASEDETRENPARENLVPRVRRARVVFLLGLLAAIAAGVYTAWAFTNRATATLTLMIHSHPPGAWIRLDGHDVGARTPQKLRGIPAATGHVLELSLSGFEPHTWRIDPSDRSVEYVVDWTMQPDRASPTPPPEGR